MFGCLTRIGCLFVLAIAAVAGWFWYKHHEHPARMGTVDSGWQQLTTGGADRAQRSVDSLSRRGGPVYVSMQPGDAAALVLARLREHLPQATNGVEARVSGDELLVRSEMSLRDIGKALGPLASMLGSRDTVLLGGTFAVPKAGLGEFHVHKLSVHEIKIPSAAIPELIHRLDKGTRPPEVAPDAIPFAIPSYISDIRVANGRVLLYGVQR